MTNTDGSIVLSTQIDQTGLKKGMNTMKSGVSSLTSAFGKLGAVIGVAFSVKAIINFAKATKELYKAQMEAETKLETVMRQRIGATDMEIQKIKDLTKSEQELGIIGDEVQLAGAQQLATFAKTTDTLETLIPAMNNLVAQQRGFDATASDAVSVANLMGKALMGQASALRRVGITFDEAEENMLKYGNEAQRAATLAQVIKNNVGDMNYTLAQTDIGRQKQLANTFGDIKEQFGQAFTQISILLLPALNAVANVLKTVATYAQQAAQFIANMFGKDYKKAPATINSAVQSQNDLTSAVEDTNKALKGQLAAFDEVNTISESSASSSNSSQELMSSAISQLEDADIIDTSKFDNIKEKLQEIGNEILTKFKPSIDTIKKSFEELSTKAKNAFKKIKKSTQDLWNDSLKPLANRVTNEFIPDLINSTTTNLVPIASDIGGVMIENFAENYEHSAKQLEKINKDIVEPAMETFVDIQTDKLDAMGKAWEEYGEGVTKELSKVDDKSRTIWDNLYEKLGEPIFGGLIEDIQKLWDKHLKPLWNELTKFFGSVTEFALTLWNNVLAPMLNFMIDIFGPAITNVVKIISDVVGTVIGIIADLIAGLLKSLRGILDFLTGVFQGDWEQAWTGLKNFVGGIWDTIWGIIKGVINLIIDGLNTLWRAIYSVFAGIGNGIGNAVGWIGSLIGKDWKFSLPSSPPVIPKLAEGGIVPHQTLAMIGEGNKKEAVLPLEQNTSWMDMLADRLADRIGGGFGGRIEVPVIIDGREIARATREAEGRMGTQTVFGGFANAY